jgi:hypothetical protein
MNVTDLPVRVISREEFNALPAITDPAIGDLVAVNARGRYRIARVAKVGPKRLSVEFTTPGAITTAEQIGSTNFTAQNETAIADQRNMATRYRAFAETIERLGYTPIDDFVSIASLPAELQALEAQSKSRNVARTTIIYPPATWLEWAENADAHADRLEGQREALAKRDALPLVERIAAHVHMTTKSVPRDAARALA